MSDGTDVTQCSLILNDVVQDTDFTVTKDTEQTFNEVLANGQYFWNVTCQDEVGNVGTSFTYNFTLEVFFPIVQDMIVLPVYPCLQAE